MSNEQELSISLPLDNDGFLRRECPTCGREFKWLSSEESETEATAIPEGGYWCPYCGIQAPPDGWWTPAQLELANSAITKEIVEPELRRFQRNIHDISRKSGGLIAINGKAEIDLPPEADPLVEVDDMRRIDFECHPNEPVKVMEEWTGGVHCLVCGTAASVP